jgi:hypothetical protein
MKIMCNSVVCKSTCLMKFTKMRFFCLPLSTMKCSGVPFTHICEWKRCYPSSVSSGSSSWIVLVTMVVVGSASMIYLLLLFYELESDSGIRSFSLSSTTNYCFERHSSVLCQEIFWKSYYFPMSFIFPLPFFSCGVEWFS